MKWMEIEMHIQDGEGELYWQGHVYSNTKRYVRKYALIFQK